MNDRDLNLAIAGLARAAPSDFKQFVAAFRVYCDDVTKQLVSSPPETLQVNQGRAKHCHEILRLLDTSPGIAEQIAKRAL